MNQAETTEDVFLKLYEKLGEIFGFSITESQHDTVLIRLKDAAKDCGKKTDNSHLCDWILHNKLSENEINILARHLTIGETYFFREKVALKLFVEQIIPELINERSRENKYINIWCAGCSSGEEPYSLAILLKETISNLAHWDIRLYATDINPDALAKAKSGLYTNWSFRETEETIRDKYFKKSGRFFQLNDEIKRMVQFDNLNLINPFASPDIFKQQPVDVIFCRNVLMYLQPEKIMMIAGKFHSMLREGGFFITSQVELNDTYFAVFHRFRYENGIFYQKTTQKVKKPVLNQQSIQKNQEISKEKKTSLLQKARSTHPLIQEKTVAASTKEKPSAVEKSDDLLQNAQTAFLSKSYDSAKKLLFKAIELNSNSHEALLLLIKVFANTGDLTEAATYASKLEKLNYHDAGFFLLIAMIYMEMNNLPEAEKRLQQALYQQPDYIAARWNLSQLYTLLGDKSREAKQYELLMRNLSQLESNQTLDEMEGMTAGQLKEMIQYQMNR